MTGTGLLAEVWGLLGLGAVPTVRVRGTTGLDGVLPVPDLAVGAVAAQLAAARLLAGTGLLAGTRRPGETRSPAGRRARADADPVEVDAAHVGLSFRSERYARVGGRPTGVGFHPLSRFWPTADGWLRLHANYPHHRAAAVRVLGEDVGPSAARWAAVELESAVVAAGGAAAAVRPASNWTASAPGRAVADRPLVDLRRVADGPPGRAVPSGLRVLDGRRVLDLTRVIAGPVATRTLASHGADVLRVDGPRLAEDPAQLVDTGPGKQHVVLDLASPADRRTVEELLAAADVVVSGYRPGALARFGLDAAALGERHPQLVVVQISAWGSVGPWGDRRGFDSLVQAATGIAVCCGSVSEPGALPAQALDHATGHLAAAAVLGALARQRVEGGGWHADLSLARTAHWLLNAPRPAALAAAGPIDPAPYLLSLPSADGDVTVVAPPGSPPWTTAARFLGSPRPDWRPRT
ncbi:CoA transferase [Geodermatophilus sabuli]|uniref:CoA transferase n=1 Tax=Geodermatophilus sabuli TaxID=1564158 RepID=UPI0019543978